MTIAEEINDLKSRVSAAYDACEEKGAEMPEDKTTWNLSTTIQSIPAGGTTDPASILSNLFVSNPSECYAIRDEEGKFDLGIVNYDYQGLNAISSLYSTAAIDGTRTYQFRYWYDLAYLELPNFIKGGTNWFQGTGSRAPDGLSLVLSNLTTLTPTSNLSATYIYAPLWTPTGSFSVGVLNNPKLTRLYMPSVAVTAFIPSTLNITMVRDRLVEVDLSQLPSFRNSSNIKMFRKEYAPNLKRLSLSCDGDFYTSGYKSIKPFFGSELIEFVNKAPATYKYSTTATEAYGSPFLNCLKLKRAVINIKLTPNYNFDVGGLFYDSQYAYPDFKELVVLNDTSVPRMKWSSLIKTPLPINATLYVADNLLNSYKSDEVWLHFVNEDPSRIKPISQWPNEPIDIWGT